MLVIVVLYEPLQAVPAVRWLVLGLAALILVLLIASGLIRPGGRTG
jgi:chromate transport protein ChrA